MGYMMGYIIMNGIYNGIYTDYTGKSLGKSSGEMKWYIYMENQWVDIIMASKEMHHL